MADQATQRMVIDASPQHIYDTLIDFEAYPRWARDLKSVRVVDRDAEGRGVDVAFRAAAMGRSTSYTLRYDHSAAPKTLSWRLLEGDIMRRLDGAYELLAIAGEPDSTEVIYTLTIELVVPLPAFVRRRAEARIMQTALRELRTHLEKA
jgi:uncharacterized membrane protein